MTKKQTIIKKAMMDKGLMNTEEVAEYYGVSESTIRRRLRERRNNENTFPIPIFGFGRVARWRRSDIEGWNEIEPEIITVETPSRLKHREELAGKGLAAAFKSKKTEAK